ncbi:MAG: flagellar basal body rod protein FlgB [Deltaproteobacteria bacterium]|nr:flagellar basal body rod protein FlgB [Deltaproteobacteria bacterium]
MDIKTSLGNVMMDRTMKILSRALDFRSSNHQVIAANLANADTPGYKNRELRFDRELKEALDKGRVQLKITDPNHFPKDPASGGRSFPVHTLESGSNEESEQNLDIEMAKMMRNNLLFEASAKLLSKKFQALRSAIESGRR